MTSSLAFAGMIVAIFGFFFFGRKFEYAVGSRAVYLLAAGGFCIYGIIAGLIWFGFHPYLPFMGEVSGTQCFLGLALITAVMGFGARRTKWWKRADPRPKQQKPKGLRYTY